MMGMEQSQEKKNGRYAQRHELVVERLRTIALEETVAERYRKYFRDVSLFLLELENTRAKMEDGWWEDCDMGQLRSLNQTLYSDIVGDGYESSYANPVYAVRNLGEETGQLLCLLYAEIRGAIPYAFENRKDYLTILCELFVEVYNCFEQNGENEKVLAKELHDIFYWYASDYCDVFFADRIVEQIDPRPSFAVRILEEADLENDRYLYRFGEYITENELGTAAHLRTLPEETLRKMADVYTEGYRLGFVNTGKDLSKKSAVSIRYVLGFEKVIRMAMDNFRSMGLQPVIYRAASSVITKRGHQKNGYTGAVANWQYEYDHRQDQALFMDKRYMERRMEVMRTVYEQHRELASGFAGPAVMETFGERPFSPRVVPEAPVYNEEQRGLMVRYDNLSGQIVNEYIRGDERSFTIVAYPIPEIGPSYAEIFDQIIKINTLDAKVYGRIQQTMIDALDQGEYVYVKGRGQNRTDMRIRLYPLSDSERETKFENCVADVNIPVGEVFTSPVLEGTNGTLHVTSVYLEGLLYKDLELRFQDGMITDYRCGNFADEEQGRAYFYDNVMKNHDTLPLGEFAIGTNTTAYMAGRKYQIEDKLPILIAEKTGPHFAVGDTCYSWSEDICVYNPDGKEIVAKDNAVSRRRKEEPSEAYFHCHTDITIPYEELEEISVVTKDGKHIILIKDGRFALPGTEVLNDPLDKE